MNKGSLVPVLLLILAFLAGTIGCGDGGEDERTDEAPKNLPPAFAGATSVRTENGSYHLLWAAATDDSTAASAITYHVYASNDPSPPSYDFASPTASVTGVALADISGLPSTGRLYFIVRACDAEGNCEENTVQQALRTFGLEKAPNFRDLGGYVNDEGRQIEWDRVFRSGELSELTDDELAFVSGFHFKRFMDLRQQLEIDRDGADRTYVGNEAIYDLLDFNVGDPYLVSAPVDPSNPLSQLTWDVRRVDYPNWYVNVLESNKDGIRRAFERFADVSQYPILFHCTQGKDRAGVVSALLLLLLEVPEDTIVADYMLTCQLTAADIEQKLKLISSILPSLPSAPEGITGDDWLPMLSCEREAMENMLHHVEANYGGAEAFLDSIGITAAQQETIKDTLLSE